MIVVDASAALLALIDDGDSRRIMAAEDLHAPSLVDSEVANGLRRTEAGGAVRPGDAVRALETWRALGIRRYHVTGLLGRIWEFRHNLSSYDATYVVLAEALECDLLSADARLSRAPNLPCPVRFVSS